MAIHSEMERAYLRAIELVEEMEAAAHERLGSRLSVLPGPWRIPKEILLASLRVQLYGCPVFGIDLDTWVSDFVAPYCNAKLTPIESIMHEYRMPSFSRQSERSVEDSPETECV